MLTLQPNEVQLFLSENKYEVVKSMVTFIPQLVKDETDVLAFVRRILHGANDKKAFLKPFECENQTHNGSIREFAMYILEESGRVGLWDIPTESHVTITPDGDIQTFDAPIPQIDVSWQRDDGEFNCIVHYVEGDSDIAETWKV